MTDDELIAKGRALLVNFDAWGRDYRSKPSPGTYAYWIDAGGKLREWLTDRDFDNARRLINLADRAGMRRAARVARNTAGEFFAASNVERSIGADIAAAAIERAAGSGG